MQTIHVKLTVAGNNIEGAVAVPEGKVPTRAVLPVLRGLTDAVVALAVREENQAGRQISCRAGCGACCRQMVPVSPAEAFAIAETVAAMPKPRQKMIRKKLADAQKKLDAAGVLQPLRRRHTLNETDSASLDRAYFTAAVPCVFLENENCGIYPERPLACREYLVTSPAQFCKNPTAERVAQVPMPAKISAALTRTEATRKLKNPWVPLVLALEFAESNHEKIPGEAAETVRKILTQI